MRNRRCSDYPGTHAAHELAGLAQGVELSHNRQSKLFQKIIHGGFNMLVLTRKTGEEIIIGDGIRVQVIDTKGGRVRLGITAPRSVSVHRSEVSINLSEARQAGILLDARRTG